MSAGDLEGQGQTSRVVTVLGGVQAPAVVPAQLSRASVSAAGSHLVPPRCRLMGPDFENQTFSAHGSLLVSSCARKSGFKSEDEENR